MKKIGLLLLLPVIWLSGCSSHPAGPESAREELTAYVWELSVPEGTGYLQFKENDFSYIIIENSSGEEQTIFSGCYEADDKTLLLHTEQTGMLAMSYALQGEELLLTWEGQPIRLTKPFEEAPEGLPEGLRE